jgi:hypothetical protein
MGRSVSTPSNCAAVCYQDASGIEDKYEWNDFKDNIQETVKRLFPSMDTCNIWIGDGRTEDNAIMENRFAYIGISEYCGLVAIWVKSKSDDYESSYYADEARLANLADGWCERIVPTFDKAFNEYRCVGRASNGEAFYEKVA